MYCKTFVDSYTYLITFTIPMTAYLIAEIVISYKFTRKFFVGKQKKNTT